MASCLAYYTGGRAGARIHTRSTVRTRAADRLPQTPKEIQQYCRTALRSEMQREEFDIMRACLLVALEEEAALNVHQSIIFENLRAQGEDVGEAVASINSRISSAVRSQFNTARIDSLADVVLHAFVQALDLPLPADLPKRLNHHDQVTSQDHTGSLHMSRPPVRPNSSTASPSSHPVADSAQSNPDQNLNEQDTATQHSDASASHASSHFDDGTEEQDFLDPSSYSISPYESPPGEAIRDMNTSPSASKGSYRHIPQVPDPLMPLQRPQRVRHLAEHPAMPPLLKSHTALFLHVASDVLFNLHGYRQPVKQDSKRGNMDSFLMNSVLETGVGAPIVLAIIFRAVCHRAGVRVNLSVLDGGSDCVVWPERSTGESGIRVSGHTLVLDIFSRGAVMLEAEVKEFFNVKSLSPSSDRDLLFALLSGLQDCNWRLALDHDDVWSRESVTQCLQAALQPITAVKEPYHLSRAVAAAERCLLVKPCHIELHLYAASLCFLDQNLHRCLQHLQLVYGGLDALGMACATGSIDRGSSSSEDQDDVDLYEGDSKEDATATSMQSIHRKAVSPPSVFTVRRNVSIEDVCLLQRPRWQGSAHAHSHMHGVQEHLAVMDIHMSRAGSSGNSMSMPEVRVVKRGSGGGSADSESEVGGDRVVAILREKEVVLRRPRRGGVANAAERAVQHSREDGTGEGGSMEEDIGVWEWSESEKGELVFVSSRGEKVALALTDQAPLPLDQSIMGEISESMGLLWHKTVLIQQMGGTGGDV